MTRRGQNHLKNAVVRDSTRLLRAGPRLEGCWGSFGLFGFPLDHYLLYLSQYVLKKFSLVRKRLPQIWRGCGIGTRRFLQNRCTFSCNKWTNELRIPMLEMKLGQFSFGIEWEWGKCGELSKDFKRREFSRGFKVFTSILRDKAYNSHSVCAKYSLVNKYITVSSNSVRKLCRFCSDLAYIDIGTSDERATNC